MSDAAWILGAAGRVGRAVAARLHEAGLPLVLAGRDRDRLARLADELGGAPRLVTGPLSELLPQLTRDAPAVVINTVGPFTATAAEVARACPPGTHYVDVTNERPAAQDILDLDQAAADTGRVLVTGAGFGVLATESVLLHVCEGRTGEPAARVRVDALASVASEPGVVGYALAASILGGLGDGGQEVRHGRLAPARLAGHPERLTTPDGEIVTTASIPTAELLAAWRGSQAESVVAASSLVPTGPVTRLFPAVSALFRVPGVTAFATGRLARVRMKARPRPRPSSWAHARVEWPSGTVREGWLRAGDGMDFTVAATAEVALRLARGEGRPGAYTPGALFGPDLAVAAGGEFGAQTERTASIR